MSPVRWSCLPGFCVPDAADLAIAEKYSAEEYMTIDAMNDDGLHLTMDGSSYGTANGRYELQLLFFEASAVGADGEIDSGCTA